MEVFFPIKSHLTWMLIRYNNVKIVHFQRKLIISIPVLNGVTLVLIFSQTGLPSKILHLEHVNNFLLITGSVDNTGRVLHCRRKPESPEETYADGGSRPSTNLTQAGIEPGTLEVADTRCFTAPLRLPKGYPRVHLGLPSAREQISIS